MGRTIVNGDIYTFYCLFIIETKYNVSQHRFNKYTEKLALGKASSFKIPFFISKLYDFCPRRICASTFRPCFFSCNLCIAAVTVHLLAAFLKLESNFVHPTLPVSVLKCTTLRYFTVADVCTRRRLSCYVLKSTHVLSIQITYGNPYSQ